MDDLWVVVELRAGHVLAMPFNDGLGGEVRDLGVADGDVAGVPCVAEILSDGDSAVLGACSAVFRVRVEVRGQRLRLKLPGSAVPEVELAATDVGVDAEHAADVSALAARRADATVLGIWRADQREAWRWVWLHEGGRDAWVAARDASRAEAAARAREFRASEEAAAAARVLDGTFVNPYTFVPLPDAVRRSAPRGHASMSGPTASSQNDAASSQNDPGEPGLSGWFDVDWAFLTDFLLPQGHPGPAEPSTVTIPGSSVKGVVRSVHEVLADGCLRVFDPEFVPVHRESHVVHGEWMLAVVDVVEPATGRPLQVLTCSDVVWVEAGQLNAGVRAKELCSGTSVGLDLGDYPTLEDATIEDRGGRRRLRADVRIDPAGSEWIVHLSDGGARLRNRPYYAALGRVGDLRRPIGATAWERFLARATGGADQARRRRERRAAASAPTGSVATTDAHRHSPGSPGWAGELVTDNSTGRDVGRRRRLDGTFSTGDTVWVRRGSGEVTELKPALLWRAEGKRPAGKRVGSRPGEDASEPGQSPLPCVHPGDLCPTCAVFGSADLTSAAAKGEQHSYGAHVRFAPLCSRTPVTSMPVELPPLGSPRPGSGMFYLSHDHLDEQARRTRLAPKEEPLSHWGSTLDAGTPRLLAGRKFYWHGRGGQANYPRHSRRPGPKDTLSRDGAQAVGAGTQFRGRVWFDNLTESQLGLLLAAVQPSLALGDVDGGQRDEQDRPVIAGRVFAVHLGGGKPLGFGTVQPRIDEASLVVHTAVSRYQGAAQPERSVQELVAAAVATRTAAGTGHAGEVPRTWRALASALTVGRVPADRIWYPPKAPWSRRLTERADGSTAFNQTFDESYRFFSVFRGGGMGKLADMEPMVPLPAATDPDQSLPIPGAGGRPGPGDPGNGGRQ